MSIPSWVRVGAKCVCVETRRVNSGYTGEVLVLGREYTVRTPHHHRFTGEPMLAVEGIGPMGAHGGPYWPVECFRPVTKTLAEDVAHIKALLKAPEHSVTTPSERIEEGVDERV